MLLPCLLSDRGACARYGNSAIKEYNIIRRVGTKETNESRRIFSSILSFPLCHTHSLLFVLPVSCTLHQAEESGKRQIEEARRRQYDEVFRQMVGVHMESVESYLEEIILEARSSVADQHGMHVYECFLCLNSFLCIYIFIYINDLQYHLNHLPRYALYHSLKAREEVRRQAAIIDEVSTAAHEQGLDTTQEGAEAIAGDLVASFLLPEVHRQAMRDQLQRHQRRFIQAAHTVSRREETSSYMLVSDFEAHFYVLPPPKKLSALRCFIVFHTLPFLPSHGCIHLFSSHLPSCMLDFNRSCLPERKKSMPTCRISHAPAAQPHTARRVRAAARSWGDGPRPAQLLGPRAPELTI